MLCLPIPIMYPLKNKWCRYGWRCIWSNLWSWTRRKLWVDEYQWWAPEETINGELSEINVRKRKRRGKQQDWNKYKNITNRLGGKEYNGRKKINGVWSYDINKPARGLKKHVIVFLKLRIIVN